MGAATNPILRFVAAVYYPKGNRRQDVLKFQHTRLSQELIAVVQDEAGREFEVWQPVNNLLNAFVRIQRTDRPEKHSSYHYDPNKRWRDGYLSSLPTFTPKGE